MQPATLKFPFPCSPKPSSLSTLPLAHDSLSDQFWVRHTALLSMAPADRASAALASARRRSASLPSNRWDGRMDGGGSGEMSRVKVSTEAVGMQGPDGGEV